MNIYDINERISARSYVSLEEIRSELGKEGMDVFLASHETIGWKFCAECNYYVRFESFDDSNRMCVSCREVVEKEMGMVVL